MVKYSGYLASRNQYRTLNRIYRQGDYVADSARGCWRQELRATRLVNLVWQSTRRVGPCELASACANACSKAQARPSASLAPNVMLTCLQRKNVKMEAAAAAKGEWCECVCKQPWPEGAQSASKHRWASQLKDVLKAQPLHEADSSAAYAKQSSL